MLSIIIELLSIGADVSAGGGVVDVSVDDLLEQPTTARANITDRMAIIVTARTFRMLIRFTSSRVSPRRSAFRQRPCISGFKLG